MKKDRGESGRSTGGHMVYSWTKGVGGGGRALLEMKRGISRIEVESVPSSALQ